MGNGLDNEVFEQQELVILSATINAVNDFGNQILYALRGHERHSDIFILNGDGVLNTPVDSVESRANIGESTLELTLFGLFSRKFTSLGDVDKDFLNSLTKLKIALLEVGVCIVESSAIDTHKGDTIDKSVHELIGKRRIAIQNFTNTGNIVGGVDFRDILLVVLRSVSPNSVDNVNGRSVEVVYSNSFRHI